MPFIAVVVIVIVIGVVVAVTVVMAAAAVMAPGKGSGKNLEKSFLRKKGRFPSGFPVRDGARVRVIGTSIDVLPA